MHSADVAIDAKPIAHLPQRPFVSQKISFNFSLAKVISIFTVAAGHWFTGTILWIPVTFGLFVFAFSSGYFTSALYGAEVDRKKFWKKKIERLWLRYWIILAFISVVVVAQGREVLHWHTLVHMVGLSGILNWTGIPSQSALGAGLWFFTLLLMFYLAYPLLAPAMLRRSATVAILLTGFVAAVVLEETVKVGHELWLTMFGFIAGMGFGMHRPRPSALLAFVLAALVCIGLLLLNVVGVKQFNTILIAAGGATIAVWLSVAEIPQWKPLKKIASFEKYLLEIFLIHMYLFIHPTGSGVLNFLLSIGLIAIAAIMLGKIADRLTTKIF